MGHIVTGQQRLGPDPSKVLPYPALMQRVTLAQKFAKANGGNLPMTPFWAKLELRFEANPRLFLTTHCDQLNRLLLNDRRAEGRNEPTPQNPLIPLPGVVVDNPPVTGTNPPGSGNQGGDGGTTVPPDNGGGFTPSPVPEPASAMLLGLGICGVLLARRLRGRRDHR